MGTSVADNLMSLEEDFQGDEGILHYAWPLNLQLMQLNIHNEETFTKFTMYIIIAIIQILEYNIQTF